MIQPQIGLPCLYRWRPGQVRAGQDDAAALITRVNSDGSVDLTVFQPGTPDTLVLNRVGRMSQEVQSHCWHPLAWMAEIDRRVAEFQSLAECVNGHAIPEPPRRGPGRPPKVRPEAAA